MDELGQILREARELKGLTLAQVHDKLRINPRYLKALEDGEYGQLPSPSHVRGYMGKYARHLDLDPAPLLERYEAAQKNRPFFALRAPSQEPVGMVDLQGMTPPPEPETGTFFNPANIDLYEEPESPWLGRLIVVALLVAIGLIGWRFAPLALGLEGERLTADSFSTAVAELLSDEANITSDPTVGVMVAPSSETLTSTQQIISTGRPTNPTIVTTAQENLAEPVPTRSPLPATMETLELQIDVTERSWLRVIVDNNTVLEGQVRRGEGFTWVGQESITIRTGNGVGVYVTLNGIDLGRMGGRGDVVEESWVTTR